MVKNKTCGKKNKNVSVVDSKGFSDMLKKVYLGGIVPEAVIDFDEGLIEAVDISNSLFLHVHYDSEDFNGFGQVGLGDLSLLCKYLEASQGEVNIGKNGNRLDIRGAGGGNLKYLCQEVEFISTSVKGIELSKLFEPCLLSCRIEENVCKQYLMYSSLVKTKAVEFVIDDEGAINAIGGLESEHKFTLDIGEAKVLPKQKFKKGFSIKVYASHLREVLSVLSWEDKEKPELMFAPNHPLLLKQNDDAFWALLPLSENQSDLGEE